MAVLDAPAGASYPGSSRLESVSPTDRPFAMEPHMNRRLTLAWLSSLLLTALALVPSDAFAAAKRVLFVTINGGYNGDGVNMYNELNTYVTATHGVEGQVDYLLLNADGLVTAALTAHTYEQI
ncbi:MAG TPA: hypothetical protein PLV68_11730, partial [Ilumatobacteraceae bacterium]|nr:hypothetical protein [Ilumatobacteraceae bacterium]